MHRAALPLLFSACVVAGCADNSSTIVQTIQIPLLSVDPASFMGSVRCEPSSLRTYVVALTNVTRTPNVDVPPSPPTPCTSYTSFASRPLGPLENGELYIGVIDGYDRSDLLRSEDPEADPRALVDPVTGAVVPPRWTTRCGEPLSSWDPDAMAENGSPNPLRFPTQVLGSTEVFLRGCIAFRPLPASDDGGDAADGATGEVDGSAGEADAPSDAPDASTDAPDASTDASDASTSDASTEASQEGAP